MTTVVATAPARTARRGRVDVLTGTDGRPMFAVIRREPCTTTFATFLHFKPIWLPPCPYDLIRY